MKNTIDNIYILGIGAVGGLYAAKLHDLNPAALKVIADPERVAARKEAGVIINGKPYHFNYINPGDQNQSPADLIIIAVKYGQLQQAIEGIKGFVGNDTIIMSLLNGISSEEIIGAEIGMEHLLYAFAVGMDAVREGNQINYTTSGRIVFGEKNNEVLTERVEAVKALLEQAGIPHQIPADMLKALWGKFMMNTGINQASAILKAPYGVFRDNEAARKLMFMAGEEVITLSQSAGVNLHISELEDYLTIIKSLSPGGKTSMLQDIEAGRKTEVDLFAGTVIKLGKKYGVSTPVNETLYWVIKAMEGV